jgi:hypothetical protein
MFVVATTAAQPPPAAIVFVTVYAPPGLDAKVTTPVTGSIINPPGEEVKAPATPPPLNVGEGFAPL